MSEISRLALFGKLNPLLFKSLESATVFCKLRGNPYVELVHWLHQLLQENDSDLLRIFRHFEIDAAQLAADVVRNLDRLPRGATSISDFSDQIETAIERGWVYATLMFNESQIRSSYWLSAMLRTRALANELRSISKEFEKISEPALSDAFAKLLPNSPEAKLQAADGTGLEGAPGDASNAMGPGAGRQDALKKYTVDWTERARQGELDPVTGRDEEVRQMIDILMRRRQNNPILVGEAGVGKTAVVEGLALRIAADDVPPAIRGVQLRMMDVGLLQAGASMKGEFENRLRSLLDEVQASTTPIILFIDEVHTLIGAGGQAGTGDAANLLKPALARGVLRTIGATTWAEYKKYIEKDPALTRRFQLVQIHEPDEAKAVHMLRGVATKLEGHHKVRIGDDAVAAAVTLSHRYIPSRQLPDKAVSLLDTACSRVAMALHATPARLEDVVRRLEALKIELEVVQRESALGVEHAKRLDELNALIARSEQEREALAARFERESEVVQRIVTAEGALVAAAQAASDKQAAAELAGKEAAAEGMAPINAAGQVEPVPATAVPVLADSNRSAPTLAELSDMRRELATMQGDDPLLQPVVDASVVASVVAEWTGIPVGRMVRDEVQSVLRLADTLEKRVIGQRHGLDAIARRIQTARAQLDNPGKPIGVFLLAGPSGVGKTETALALAESLYGGEQNLITINMSEFQEAHTVSTLKGSPPGYVGYGEGGVLTEAVRRRPYSVVLLDEIEKAHSDVHEIFFQVFDKGWMEDGEGRYIDFKNTVIILTSNVGSELIAGMCRDPDLVPPPDALAKAVRQPLLEKFPAALLGRLVVVPYFPISDAMLDQIIRLQMKRIQTRIHDRHGTAFIFDESAVALIRNRCSEVESGARMVDGILTQNLLPRLATQFLQCSVESQSIQKIQVSAADNDFVIAYE
jgi:type VI secretion system protein VasG